MRHLSSAKTRLAAAIFRTAPLRFSLSVTRSPPLQTGLETQTDLTGRRLKLEKKMAVHETGVTLVGNSGGLRIIRARPEVRITEA